MESTAINTVYVIMHIVGYDEFTKDVNKKVKFGYLWEVFAREDEARERCKKYNELDSNDSKSEYIVVERKLN